MHSPRPSLWVHFQCSHEAARAHVDWFAEKEGVESVWRALAIVYKSVFNFVSWRNVFMDGPLLIADRSPFHLPIAAARVPYQTRHSPRRATKVVWIRSNCSKNTSKSLPSALHNDEGWSASGLSRRICIMWDFIKDLCIDDNIPRAKLFFHHSLAFLMNIRLVFANLCHCW